MQPRDGRSRLLLESLCDGVQLAPGDSRNHRRVPAELQEIAPGVAFRLHNLPDRRIGGFHSASFAEDFGAGLAGNRS